MLNTLCGRDIGENRIYREWVYGGWSYWVSNGMHLGTIFRKLSDAVADKARIDANEGRKVARGIPVVYVEGKVY